MSFVDDSDLQIWNNAAFDSGDFEDSSGIKAPWTPLKNIFTNVSESIDSDQGKENIIPVIVKQSSVSVKSSVPMNPLQAKSATVKSQGKSVKVLEEEEVRDEGKIDAEIEEIRLEISRLSSRLDELCLEKVKRSAKMVEKRGRIVAAKFMEQKQSVKGGDGVKTEESSSVRTKVHRRGVSLGPSEIVAGVRRGMSLGPSEIASGGRLRHLGKPEVTPISTQSRRKSCFWKLEDIDEGKVTKERGKSMTVSPKNRKIISKTQASKQAATTIASKRPVKKELGFVSSIQPKKLFTDGEKSAKKPLKNGRVVASRYSLIGNQSTGGCSSSLRKRSLPENEDNGRVKKKWEIPSEVVVVHKSLENDESPPSPRSITKMPDILPMIRTDRCINESPRNSGPAKRVAELIGRKSYFCADEDGEDHSVSLSLDFAEASLVMWGKAFFCFLGIGCGVEKAEEAHE
ncbi:hypothetical protein CK203_025541 [Vitis vinifera]|uniref:Uncharacterized protein n=1 Tax=Vitis vinifera TaxID=29760 RepID=A0A438IEE8_VITVI|nr:hypothetical protein CK203_025541 [Vitis vinifera]